MKCHWISILLLSFAGGVEACQSQRPAPTTSTTAASDSRHADTGSAIPRADSNASAPKPAAINSSAPAINSSAPAINSSAPAINSSAPIHAPLDGSAEKKLQAPGSASAARGVATPDTVTNDGADAAIQPEVKAKLTNKVQRVARRAAGKGVLRYPEVAAKDPKATRAINDSITRLRTSYYDPTDPADTDTSLVGMRFTVNHNDHGILSLTFETDWSGAYPSKGIEHRCYWLPTGEELEATRLVDPPRLDALLATLDSMLQREIAETRNRHQTEPDWENVKDNFDVHFSRDTLRSFRVGSDGITFYFDYGVAHAWKALEPPGEFFLSFIDLERYLRRDGPLAGMVRTAKRKTNVSGRK